MSDVSNLSNNPPDYAASVTDRLNEEYAATIAGASALLEEARKLPKVITDEAELALHASMIERMRDSTARFKTYHATEKEPHLRAGQAVDQFFFGWWEKLARRNSKDKPGAADILQARVNDYMQKKLAEERRVREEAAAKARAEEQRIANERAEAERKATEAAAAAARARKPENIEAHEQNALDEAAKAAQLASEQARAQQETDDARIDLLAKPADMVRTRTDGGQLVTMKQVPMVLIEDVSKLDLEALRPYIKEDHLLQALKAWAKISNHKKQMPGAVIKMVDEAVVR